MFEEDSEIFIPVPYGHISGKTYGECSGQRVVAIHGWTDNAGTFDLIAPLLSSNIYLVVIDLPGHGKSSHLPPGIPCNQMDYVLALRRVVKYLNWSTFDCIGHSLGAGIGVLYAALFPDEIMKMVIVDYVKLISWANDPNVGSLFGSYSSQFLALDRNRSPQTVGYSLDELKELYLEVTGGKIGVKGADMLLKRGTTQVEPTKWIFSKDPCVRSPGTMRMAQDLILDILTNVKCKILLLKASEEEWFEPLELCKATMEIYEKNCKSYQFIEVPGNHFIPLSNPTIIAPYINQFLA